MYTNFYGKYNSFFFISSKKSSMFSSFISELIFSVKWSVMKSQNTDTRNLKRVKRSAIFLALPNRTEASKWAQWTRVFFLWRYSAKKRQTKFEIFGKSTTLNLWQCVHYIWVSIKEISFRGFVCTFAEKMERNNRT